ncbi:DUF7373 family lipoprotein [Nocardia wallacei]|uniref:DUF7373 family lipoprotein n=1 Tax=Nocardia wallacei TaxID=480035 RepID=UPI0024589BD4|nr:hypothetical protein [Nocardia wallacei]
MKKKLATLVITSAMSLLAAACGTVPGKVQPAEIDVRTLDTGSYNTDPAELRYDYTPNLTNGKQIAIMRLADVIAPGPDIDAKLDYGGAAPVLSPADATSIKFAENFVPVLTRHDMLYGMQTANSDRSENGPVEGDTAVNISVFQFPSDEAAAAAAQEFEAADFDIAKDQNQPVALNKYPKALSHWRPGIRTMGTRMARGSYVLSIFVRTPRSEVSDLAALAERVYDAQLPLLDTLPPVSKRDLLHLPFDPFGIFRKTFHPNDLFGVGIPGEMWLSDRAYLHFVDDKKATREIFRKTGVDAIGVVQNGISSDNNAAVAWRTRDFASAATLSDYLRGKSKRLVDSPPKMPDTFCSENVGFQPSSFTARNYNCTVRYDRFVGKVSSSQLLDAQQRAAAQYALFANSSW